MKMTQAQQDLFERKVLVGLVCGDSITVQGYRFQRLSNQTLFVQIVNPHPRDPGRSYMIEHVLVAIQDILYLIQHKS